MKDGSIMVIGIAGGTGSGKTTLLDHSRDQYTAKSSNGSRTGTGDRTEEAGYDDTHDGDAASSVSDTGINEPDQALGDACLCHDVAGQYKKRNGKQQKLADAGIHVGCHDR